jgi:hypothetical protein
MKNALLLAVLLAVSPAAAVADPLPDVADFAECSPAGVFEGETVSCRSAAELPDLRFRWSLVGEPVDPSYGPSFEFEAPAAPAGWYRLVEVRLAASDPRGWVTLADSVEVIVVSRDAPAAAEWLLVGRP